VIELGWLGRVRGCRFAPDGCRGDRFISGEEVACCGGVLERLVVRDAYCKQWFVIVVAVVDWRWVWRGGRGEGRKRWSVGIVLYESECEGQHTAF